MATSTGFTARAVMACCSAVGQRPRFSTSARMRYSPPPSRVAVSDATATRGTNVDSSTRNRTCGSTSGATADGGGTVANGRQPPISTAPRVGWRNGVQATKASGRTPDSRDSQRPSSAPGPPSLLAGWSGGDAGGVAAVAASAGEPAGAGDAGLPAVAPDAVVGAEAGAAEIAAPGVENPGMPNWK